MTRRRRGFEVELPLDDGTAFPAGKADRPSPMASAVRETAAALGARAAAEAAIRAENDALAMAHVAARRAGRVVELVPVARIRATKLTRDRAQGPDPELAELAASIRAVGLSHPVRVEPQADGGFELIQGFRRLAAYRALLAETGDPAWAAIPAVVEAGDGVPLLYRRMVDENLVRKDISFAEMAALARAYAADPATGAGDLDAAVTALYGSAGAQKRSYIRAFAALLDAVGDHLRHPQAVPRALGLALRRAIEPPGAAATLAAALDALGDRDAEAELALLARFAAPRDTPPDPPDPPALPPVLRGGPVPAADPRIRAVVDAPQGRAICTAGDGWLQIRLDRDFTALHPVDLDRAVRGLLDALDG